MHVSARIPGRLAFVGALLVGGSSAQELATELKRAFADDDLPALLARLEADGPGAGVADALQATGARAHRYLLGVLRNPPTGRFPVGSSTAFGEVEALRDHVPMLMALAAQRGPTTGEAAALLRRIAEVDAVAAARTPDPAPFAGRTAELARIVGAGPDDLRWPAVQALVLIGGDALLAAATALLHEIVVDDETRRARAFLLLGAVRAAASGAALLEPDAWRLVPGERVVHEWALIAASGGRRAAAADALLARLDDPDARVRAAAMIALCVRGDGEARVLDAMVARRTDRDPTVAATAEHLLVVARAQLAAAHRDAVARSRDRLATGESGPRVAALLELRGVGAAAESLVEHLVPIALRGERGEAGLAADVLAGVGALAVPHLVAAMDDADPEVRVRAVRALGRIEPAAPAATLTPLVAWRDRDERVRNEAVNALSYGAVSPRVELVANALADAALRGAALAALDRLAWQEGFRDALAPHLGRLSALVESGDADARGKVFRLLWRVGAVDSLAGFVDHDDPHVRHAALRALAGLGHDAAAAFVRALPRLDDPTAAVAAAAADCLVATGVARERLALELAERLASAQDAGLWVAFARALGRLGADAGAAAAALRARFAAAAPAQRVPLAVALVGIGAADAEAVACLREALAGGGEAARGALAELSGLGAGAAPLCEPVVALLGADDDAIVAAAAACLGAIGADAAVALPALRARLERGGEQLVTYRIERAIAAIGGEQG
jgi:hypothetical protein